ncbi:MAG: hypothetical protein HY079_09375 [Elusimicrobia bacterium]|nr:hypothetical protein [Elusimicrobiota bacterium]
MRKALMVCGLIAAGCFVVATAKAQDKKAEAAPAAAAAGDKKEAPEFITFDKAKLGAVKFPHKAHADMLGGCAACHEGKEPLFAQKTTGGMKMADMKAGKGCGSCHNGKEMQVGKEKKVVFTSAAKCTTCHKKS